MFVRLPDKDFEGSEVREFSTFSQLETMVKERYPETLKITYGPSEMTAWFEYGPEEWQHRGHRFIFGKAVCPHCSGTSFNPVNEGKPNREWINPIGCPKCGGWGVV